MKITPLKIALWAVVSLSALIIILGVLFYKNALIALGAWNNANKMSIFLKIDADNAQKTELIKKIKSMANVTQVQLIDRGEAGRAFQKTVNEYAAGLITNDEMLDLIPETIEVDLESHLSLNERRTRFEDIATALKSDEAVDDVSFSSEWVEKFEKIDRFLRSIGLSAFIVLALSMSCLASLMVRVFIDDSKSEIEVYTMLGATRWSIYKVFLWDILIFEFLSITAAFAAAYLLFRLFIKSIDRLQMSKVITDNLQFLSASEIAVLVCAVVTAIFALSFYTVTSSINRLNQISND